MIDTHSDTTMRMLDPDWDFMERHETGHVDYPRIREGGLNAVFLAIYMGPQEPEAGGIAESVDKHKNEIGQDTATGASANETTP